jgi:hypothetical protein
MKKIALSLIALTAVSSAALAGSAFDKAMDRNKIEFPDHYSATVDGSYAAGDALAVIGHAGSIKYAPGEDGNHRR